jgi:hypothetical protein
MGGEGGRGVAVEAGSEEGVGIKEGGKVECSRCTETKKKGRDNTI